MHLSLDIVFMESLQRGCLHFKGTLVFIYIFLFSLVPQFCTDETFYIIIYSLLIFNKMVNL